MSSVEAQIDLQHCLVLAPEGQARKTASLEAGTNILLFGLSGF
jgi:hypothetical protein